MITRDLNSRAVFSVRDVATILDIGVNAAYRLVREKVIFSVRIGKQYRIPRDALERYLKQ